MSEALNLSLHEKQGLAFMSPATEILYGGAAGGGKSHLMRVASIAWCYDIPGLQVYFFRRMWDDLVKTHMKGPTSFHALLAPLVRTNHVRILDKEIRFWNGSAIYLNHLQHPRHLPKYDGYEMHVLVIDEATHFTEQMYRFLRSRVRMTGIDLPERYRGMFPRILAGTNPGGPGHHFFKSGWVEQGEERIVKQPKKEGGMTRQFVPAKLADNPSMAENYADMLEGLGDPILVRAKLDGDWGIIAGSMFGDRWRDHLHTCRPFPIPSHWELWRGGDDGYGSPASAHWLTQDPVAKTFYIIAELYRTQMTPNIFWEETHRIDLEIELVGQTEPWNPFERETPPEAELHLNPNNLSGIMDSAAFSNNGQSDTPRGAQMNKLGARWTKCQKWPGSIVHRIQNLHRLLKPNPDDEKRRPGIIFFDTCTDAIRTIPALLRDEKDPEKIADGQEDHAFDSVTYGLQKKVGGARRVRVKGN